MATNPTNYVLMIAELRRSYAHLDSYKSDIVVLSGKHSLRPSQKE